ncbi:prepilin-type N-terminal cleavage/methylation domain-containing protein [Pseudoalteromonas sp. MMG024]|uniref:type IV pilus modification PilV family protein n=1 Tax=Pseudoalteromonas sp. MMG024 TaxID=2909980 RepID=UPI001F1DF239|nr:prepilin-type N-terminal cleavage/methylation domain-containing protein [Pseudoalteromonas sp. MMG024]MCF6458441.1 prepilin-type N-terminal cleavage/methylation domain-containing protein [Pseudoalteromonas sp. MMG024]
MHVNRLKGFTLVEVIFGIVLMAIVLTIVTGLLAPQAKQSADPVIQVKANELGQAMMNEILGRSFDEQSRRSPPYTQCGIASSSCTLPSDLGCDDPEEKDINGKCIRNKLNDVDDFIGNYQAADLQNSLGQPVTNLYPGFSLSVNVVYDDDANGIADTSGDYNTLKLITVTVTAPTGEVYGFSAYKGNY